MFLYEEFKQEFDVARVCGSIQVFVSIGDLYTTALTSSPFLLIAKIEDVNFAARVLRVVIPLQVLERFSRSTLKFNLLTLKSGLKECASNSKQKQTLMLQ